MKKSSVAKAIPKKGINKSSKVLKNKTEVRKKLPVEHVKRVMEIESFNLGNMIREARLFKNLTQEALAIKSGTTKHYISRIENNSSTSTMPELD